ncbi:hypothetical protein BSKO_02380 [Bryopsis sp. KO-2023]|nr:hypothetical protein BSKO_02380 [Bryopsis sp. KO-2023]
MGGILGVPGGHCGALLKVSSLSFRADFLDGFKHIYESWSSIEINKLDIRDVILMPSRRLHSIAKSGLLSPWKSVELSYRMMYFRQRGENLSRCSEASPFQAECSTENVPPESQIPSNYGYLLILFGKPPCSSSVGTPVETN